MIFIRFQETLTFNIASIMNRQKTLGIIRHLLTFGAGIATARGYVQEDIAQEIIGGLVLLIGTIWSIFAPEKSA